MYPKFSLKEKFPQNVRALRIDVEQLLRPMLVSSELNEDLHNMIDVVKLIETSGERSKITKLWVEYLIKPVFIMMMFVRAEREGDWPLHMFAVEKMLPYFLASEQFSCARYGLYYLRSMQRLPLSVHQKFMKGEHVIYHQDGIWNGIWSDLFIETTYMRYGHGPSGIIGFT